MSLKDIADLPPEEITRLDWEFVHKTLVDAQAVFEEKGHGRQSWMDGAIDIAKARKEPSDLEPLWYVAVVRPKSKLKAHTWIAMTSKKAAVDYVLRDYKFLREGGFYPFAVIEAVRPNSFGWDKREEIWFSLDEVGASECARPEPLAQVVNFTIG